MNYSVQPKYSYVVFEDTSCEKKFLIRSTVQSEKIIQWEDGKEYPHVLIDVSSASHPFYTGERRTTASEGRVAKFQKRFTAKISAQK